MSLFRPRLGIARLGLETSGFSDPLVAVNSLDIARRWGAWTILEVTALRMVEKKIKDLLQEDPLQIF